MRGVKRDGRFRRMRAFLLIPALSLGGCAALEPVLPTDRDPALTSDPAPVVSEDDGLSSEAQTPSVVVGSATPDAALPPPPGAGSSLGTTIVSLGDPGEGGMWLKTPLVQSQTPGQVRYQGNTVAVTLRPLDGPPGAGSQISLRAMQALGAPLTELVEVIVDVS